MEKRGLGVQARGFQLMSLYNSSNNLHGWTITQLLNVDVITAEPIDPETLNPSNLNPKIQKPEHSES